MNEINKINNLQKIKNINENINNINNSPTDSASTGNLDENGDLEDDIIDEIFSEL